MFVDFRQVIASSRGKELLQVTVGAKVYFLVQINWEARRGIVSS